MNNKIFIILTVMLTSLLFSKEEYSHIYLMEFENVNSEITINNLSRALPDIVIQNYEFRGDLSVGYLDTIEPYFPNEYKDNRAISGLIINGRFSLSDSDVDIEVELYDLSTWDLLGKESFYCPVENMSCIHDAFLIVIDELLEDYILAEEETGVGLGKNITKRIVYSKNEPVDNTDVFNVPTSYRTDVDKDNKN